MSRLARKPTENHRSVPPPSKVRTHAARGKRKLGHAPTFGRNFVGVAKTSQSSASLPATAGRGRRSSSPRARSEAPQAEALFFGFEHLKHLEAVGRLEVLVHYRMDGADHRVGRVQLEDVAAHIHASGALLDGIIGHGERLELGQFLAAG